MKKAILTTLAALVCWSSFADTRLITALDILDAWEHNYNISHWVEQGNLQEGQPMYGEEENILITRLSPEIKGADWIQTAYGSKNYIRENIAYFQVKADAEVWIAHNDKITDKPAWLSFYDKTREQLTNSRGETFTFYKRGFHKGETIALGNNGSSIYSMYLVAIRPRNEWPAPAQPGGKIFDIREFGAIGDGKTVNTKAIQSAIDQCSRKGGTVYIHDGIYVTGTLELKSNITLYVAAGSILRGSANHDDYPEFHCVLPSFRSNEHFQLLYAENQSNITLTGGGIIDGYSLFEGYPWKGRNNEHERPRMIRMVTSKHIQLKGITLIRSANWTQYYEGCEDLKVENVNVRCYTGTNNQDGIDISGCKDVIIRNFTASCGDDAICVKSLSMLPGENIDVDGVRCRYANCNIVKIGTETHGAVRNMRVRNVEGWTRYCIAIESVDGAIVENITYENIRMYTCAAPFVVCLGNRGRIFKGGPEKAPAGAIRNITLRNIRNTDIGYVDLKGGPGVGAPIGGLPGNPIQNVTIEDCDFLLYGNIHNPELVYRDVPENSNKYPEFNIYGTCPAYGLFFRHVDGLICKNVTLRLKNRDIRPAIIMDDVKNYRLEGIQYDQSDATLPFPLWHKQDGELKNSFK